MHKSRAAYLLFVIQRRRDHQRLNLNSWKAAVWRVRRPSAVPQRRPDAPLHISNEHGPANCLSWFRPGRSEHIGELGVQHRGQTTAGRTGGSILHARIVQGSFWGRLRTPCATDVTQPRNSEKPEAMVSAGIIGGSPLARGRNHGHVLSSSAGSILSGRRAWSSNSAQEPDAAPAHSRLSEVSLSLKQPTKSYCECPVAMTGSVTPARTNVIDCFKAWFRRGRSL